MSERQILTFIGVVAAVYILLPDASVLNPAHPNNFVYRSVNAIGDHLDDKTDNDSFNLGSSIYDLFHPDSGSELE
jgi:hypothetical protein